jgi:ubiquinol-cytochrome c reductase cytochrome b subunit
VEGALRLFPPWEIRNFGHSIPNPFFPAVLLPGVTFGLLYAWPWLERAFTKDDAPHELLDRPTRRPVRSAIGAGVLTFYLVLLLAASHDIIARVFKLPVADVTNVFRVLLFVLPVVVGYVVYRWFRAVVVTDADSAMHVGFRDVFGHRKVKS